MSLLITLLIYLAILGVAWWALNEIAPPKPFRIVAVVIIALVAIYMLLSLVGAAPALGGPLHGRL